MIPFALGCVFAACGLGLSGILAWLVIRKYRDVKQSEMLPIVVTGVVLALIFCCIALIPFDVFSVSSANWKSSSTNDSSSMFSSENDNLLRQRSDDVFDILSEESSKLDEEVEEPGTVVFVKIVQYVLYCLLTVTLFLLVPFAYFYYEESDMDITKTKRVLGALKYTGFLLLAMIVLLIIGLFVNTGKTDESEFDTAWFDQLKGSVSSFESVIAFFVACLMLIGFVIYLVYTAYGISALAMSLIVGRQHAIDEMRSVEVDLEDLRNKRKKIEAKASVGIELSKKDEKTLEEISRKERVDEEHVARLKEGEGRIKCGAKMRALFILLGMVLFLVAGAIVVSLFMTLLDTILHSECGYKCGYILTNPEYTNPLDAILLILAKLYPLDFVIVGGLAIFLLIGTLKGLSVMGIRILWIELFKLRDHKTSPQGLLLASLYLALSLMATQQQLMMMAPRYMAFGSQTYVNATGDTLYCDVQAPQSVCHMTQIARMNYVATGTNQSFIGVILYYGTWLFIITWIIGFVVSFFRRKPANVVVDEEEIDDALLDGSVPAAKHSSKGKDKDKKGGRKDKPGGSKRRVEREAAARARFHLRKSRSSSHRSDVGDSGDVPPVSSSSKGNNSAILT